MDNTEQFMEYMTDGSHMTHQSWYKSLRVSFSAVFIISNILSTWLLVLGLGIGGSVVVDLEGLIIWNIVNIEWAIAICLKKLFSKNKLLPSQCIPFTLTLSLNNSSFTDNCHIYNPGIGFNMEGLQVPTEYLYGNIYHLIQHCYNFTTIF